MINRIMNKFKVQLKIQEFKCVLWIINNQHALPWLCYILTVLIAVMATRVVLYPFF